MSKFSRHGLSGSPTYRSWAGMLQRVLPDAPKAHRYAERGIVVCERWRTFASFLADMGECPPGRTLDRVNNDGNYEPGNCRWATPKEQGRNTCRTNDFETGKAIAAALLTGERPADLCRRLGLGSSLVSSVGRSEAWRDAREAAQAEARARGLQSEFPVWPNSRRLTGGEVEAIRVALAQGENGCAVARRFGINRATVQRLKTRLLPETVRRRAA